MLYSSFLSLILINQFQIPKEQQKQKHQKKKEIKKIEQENDENEHSLEYQNQFISIKDKNEEQRQKLERQKKQLKEDILSYQESIRKYINQQQKFYVYQQFVNETQLHHYLKETVELSSAEIKKLNYNPHLFSKVEGRPSLSILIAKDKKNDLEIGIGIFHKQYQSGHDQYVCDYLLAHNIKNFLNLTFNFSRYMFEVDPYTNQIQFQFDLSKVQDKQSLKTFAQFQLKYQRLGQVYVQVNSFLIRKYIMRRNLFHQVDNTFQSEGKGIKFDIRIQVHEQYMNQKGKGFQNRKKLAYGSSNTLLAYHLRKNSEKLKMFRQKVQDDLKYRQLLLTALLFQKKLTEIPFFNEKILTFEEKISLVDSLSKTFFVNKPESEVKEMRFDLNHPLVKGVKRCTFTIEDEAINYLIVQPEDTVTRIQASNSSQTGLFLNLIPKHKLLIIEGQEFLRMSLSNTQINVFYYVKNFIKNIVEVQKQTFPRIFLPQVCENDWSYLDQISKKVHQNVFLKQQIQIGWSTNIPNSVVFNPNHKDLVIRKPFIVSLLSGDIEKIVEGSPILAKLIV